MRQPSIPFPLARASLVALATAAALAAQSPEFRASRVDADTGEAVPRWSAPSFDASSFASEYAAAPQDEDDYSVTGMFSEFHGEFMQKGFPFRNNLRVWYGYQAETEVSGSQVDFEFNDVRGEVFVPTTLDPDMLLILGGRIGNRRYDFTVGGSGAGDEDLSEVAAHVGLGRFLTEDLYVEAVFRPGVYSDFDGTVHGDDWKFYGDIIATYRFDVGFYGKVGAVYDGTFEDAPAYPVLGFALLVSDEFRVDMLLPKSLEVSWIPDPSWILTAGLGLDGEEYHVRAPLNASGNKPRFDVRTQEMRLYVDGTYRFNDNFSAFGRVGGTLLGDYEWGPQGAPGSVDGSIDPAGFLELGFGVNF